MDSMRDKPGGFDFWRHTLNGAQYVVAPMVDQSELAWRMLSRKYGAQLCYTPMFHASVFVRDVNYRRESLQTCAEDRPLIVQFCANDPDTLVQAARLAQPHCDAVDLNLGCPQSIARRGHYGAFLQDEWDLVYRMVSECHAKLTVPITCKIRILESVERTVQYAKMLESAGCQLLTVHGRTREQKGAHTGLADWSVIKAVVESVKIPVFANGNIQYLPDVEACMKATEAVGVMSAEGNLHNPALFHGLSPLIWEMALEYLEFVDKYPCPISYVRGHIFKILFHALQIHLEVREQVATAKTMEDFRTAIQNLRICCKADIDEYQNDPENFKSSLPLPYWICQPYVRPPPCQTEDAVKKAERERLTMKRTQELTAAGFQAEGLSKNKIKKKLRHPKINFNPANKVRYEKCDVCANPKGQRCVFSLCKSCCKRKSFSEMLDCPGHGLTFKTKMEKKLQNARICGLQQAERNHELPTCPQKPSEEMS